jgi:hypothetical protein
MIYIASAPKAPAIGIRLESDEKAALEAAAAADDRPLSSMGRKIIAEWLREQGFLKPRNSEGPGPASQAQAEACGLTKVG